MSFNILVSGKLEIFYHIHNLGPNNRCPNCVACFARISFVRINFVKISVIRMNFVRTDFVQTDFVRLHLPEQPLCSNIFS
jgi:hypothetical protein